MTLLSIFHTLADWQRHNEPYTSLGAVVVIVLTLYIDVRTDAKVIHTGGKVKHIRGAWLRVPSIIITGLLDWQSCFVWPLYWPLFDGFLNVMRNINNNRYFGYRYKGFGWFYLGTSSWLDRMQHRFKWLVGVKYGLAITALIIYLTFKF